VEPISDLAEGTRDVANGDYANQLPMRGHDELGFLVASFNQMTRRISRARNQAQLSQQQAEEQRAYLEAVLAHLSSGVLTLDQDGTGRTANSAAQEILSVDLSLCIGESLDAVAEIYPHMKRFVDMVMDYLHDQAPEWRDETVLFGRAGRQVLILHGTRLQVETIQSGDFVLVFDDVTTLVQAQRDAAWGEVARRLAHEIKNPLTPIQLSAERLRHKFLASMDADAAKVLDRATHTIVQQVESMKEMVNAFSEYARAPQIRLERIKINKLVNEVCELYRAASSPADIHLSLDQNDPVVEADSGRLRQLFHNLIKNAQEASEGAALVRIDISTRCMDEHGCEYCEITVRDYGEGFPEDALGQYFEPYVTTKPKGTGLGLAIVKKIVEEHGGMIWIENVRTADTPDAEGAQVQVRLPVVNTVTDQTETEDSHVE
ncbi:MAG TPA: HAMP domain-containing protein, partial [Gammaproteobacteria bacterium]|nr:HAMP domain-containing protein [Gammaproteobacteria bacterium]